MDQYSFNETLMSVSPRRWEQALPPIGKFTNLEIAEILERPFSYSARCRIEGSDGSRNVYVKLFRNDDNKSPKAFREVLKKDYEVAQKWYELFDKSENFRAVKPLMLIPEKSIFVTEESRGHTLFELIDEKARYFPSKQNLSLLSKAAFQVGSWLRYKHSISHIESEKYTIDELIEYLDVRLKILTEDKRRCFNKEYRNRILSFIQNNEPNVTDEEYQLSVSHSDFNPGNIIVDGNIVTGLDFGRQVKDSYLLDLVKLYHQLQLWIFKPHYRKNTIFHLQKALLEGFGEPDSEQLMMFKFLYIRNILTHLTNITSFWKYDMKQKLYNLWVAHNEMRILQSVVSKT